MKAAALRFSLVLAALGLPGVASAQEEGSDAIVEDSAEGGAAASGQQHQRAYVVPYIEVQQVLTQELEPGNDTLTYTTLAAGVDASIAGRNSAASVSLRYERRFDYGDDTVAGDTLSGVARGALAVARGVSLEAGAMAARTHVEGNGSSSLGGFLDSDASTSQIYSGYVGPSVHTMAGDVEVEGHYRLGYTKVESPDSVVLAPGAAPVDLFDESVTHVAHARAGVRPDVVAPVGLGLGGGWTEQNVDNLDQRIRDRYVRADATLPVSPTVALVGGVGYEDVEISSRDAVRDAAGNPVIGPDGRYVTDESAPRMIAYETDGLIWDVGVLWRPSRRTSLEAYVGRRYGSMTYHGNFSYAPDAQTSFNLAVYDSVNAFGGAMIDQLAGLPTQFDAFRNPVNGEIGGCVASVEGGNCIAGALGSLRSAAFRSRGVVASYGTSLGRMRIGAGVGYDRRTYLTSPGTVLADLDGVVDETVWMAAYAGARLDQRSDLSLNLFANWFESGFDLSGDVIGYSASLAYRRELIRRLSGIAAVSLDGIARENLPDTMSASGLIGLRYSFD